MYGNERYGTLEMPFIVIKAGEYVAKSAESVIKERQAEMQEVCQIIKFIMDKVQNGGLLALEDSIEDIRESRAPLTDFLADYILLVAEGSDRSLILEMMANEFVVRKTDDFDIFVLYLYMVIVILVRDKSFYDMVEGREEAWKNLVKIKNEYMVYLPGECRKLFGF